jgi:hypothetical protein
MNSLTIRSDSQTNYAAHLLTSSPEYVSEPVLNLNNYFKTSICLKSLPNNSLKSRVNNPFQYFSFLSQRTVRRRKHLFSQEMVLSTTHLCFSR